MKDIIRLKNLQILKISFSYNPSLGRSPLVFDFIGKSFKGFTNLELLHLDFSNGTTGKYPENLKGLGYGFKDLKKLKYLNLNLQ